MFSRSFSHGISFLKWIKVDRAIAYSVLNRLWQVFAGPLTIILFSLYVSPETQGFYYIFINLIALQTLADLGFTIVITQFASHEWVLLSYEPKQGIIGDPKSLSRLTSLSRLIFKWYAYASVVFIAVIGTGGYLFLSQKSQPGITWENPWIAYIFLSGLQLWVLPFLSFLEGCGQVARVNFIRLVQVILGTLAMWITMVLGGNLWMAVSMLGAGLLANIGLMCHYYKSFFQSLIRFQGPAVMDWKREVWPMQWRLAVSGVTGYLTFSLITPVMFHYHGAVVAGQVGMTFQIIGVLGGVAMAWVNTKVPTFGMLIAKKNFFELDRLFIRVSLISILIFCLGATTLWSVVFAINKIGLDLAGRLLSPSLFGILCMAMLFLHISACQTQYLRAHKKEPIMVLSLTTSLLNGFLIWGFGSLYGPIGAILSLLATMALILVPFETLIFYRCRKEWHR